MALRVFRFLDQKFETFFHLTLSVINGLENFKNQWIESWELFISAVQVYLLNIVFFVEKKNWDYFIRNISNYVLPTFVPTRFSVFLPLLSNL